VDARAALRIYKHHEARWEEGLRSNNPTMILTKFAQELRADVALPFRDTICQWTISQIRDSKQFATALPIPRRFDNKEEYYSAFTTLILEETRAALSQKFEERACNPLRFKAQSFRQQDSNHSFTKVVVTGDIERLEYDKTLLLPKVRRDFLSETLK